MNAGDSPNLQLYRCYYAGALVPHHLPIAFVSVAVVTVTSFGVQSKMGRQLNSAQVVDMSMPSTGMYTIS